MIHCKDHADMAERVTRIEANTSQIIVTLQRIEERVYQDHGKNYATSGLISGALKVAAIAATVGAAIATAITLVAN